MRPDPATTVASLPYPAHCQIPAAGKATRYCPSDRLKGFDAPTVWQEFTPLAITTKGALRAARCRCRCQRNCVSLMPCAAAAVNLGQGFPDWPCPEFLKVAAARAIANNNNQVCIGATVQQSAASDIACRSMRAVVAILRWWRRWRSGAWGAAALGFLFPLHALTRTGMCNVLLMARSYSTALDRALDPMTEVRACVAALPWC